MPSLGEGQPLGNQPGLEEYKGPASKSLPPHTSCLTTTTITTSLALFSWSSSIPYLLAVFPSSGGPALPLLGVITSVCRCSMDQVFTSTAQRRRQQTSNNLSPKSLLQLLSSLVGTSALGRSPTLELLVLALSGTSPFLMRHFNSQAPSSANYSIVQTTQLSCLFSTLFIPGVHLPLCSLTSYSHHFRPTPGLPAPVSGN